MNEGYHCLVRSLSSLVRDCLWKYLKPKGEVKEALSLRGDELIRQDTLLFT